MEGFGTRSGMEYWQVKKGYFAKKVSEDTVGAVATKKQDGTVYHELRRDFFTGKLKRVEIKTHDEYGDFLKLRVIANGKEYSIEMDFDSGYAFGFLSTVPNIALEDAFLMSPSYKEEDGKKRSRMFIQQNGSWLKQYFTRDTPNGLPELKKIKVKGKETWDNTERLDWFKETLIPKLNKKLEDIWGNEPEEEDEEVEGKEQDSVTKTLPF